MGHAEDLEEYESKLELALKREYQTVYPLFLYCVITHEATYLCNSIEVRHVAGAGVVMFDLQMDDVWVWDRNRPSRIIPSARVFTTADLSIEQLKDADDGSLLTDIVPVEMLESAFEGAEESGGEADAETAATASAEPSDGDEPSADDDESDAKSSSNDD